MALRRYRLSPLTDQDPNSFQPFSRLRSGTSPLVYPHPDLSQGVTRQGAMHALLTLISCTLADRARQHPPIPNPQDLVPWWPLLYPYTEDRQGGGCMEYDVQRVRALARSIGSKRVWMSPKRSLVYLEIKLGRGVDSHSRHKKPFIITSTHRVIYWCFYGPIGELLVLHACGNHRCLNPNHLKAGTRLENWRDWEVEQE